MKKKFLRPLLILFAIFFGLVSCNSHVKTQTDVSISFPVQQLYNIISARAGEESSVSLELKAELTVNGTKKLEQISVLENKHEDKTFVFDEIPINSIVYAQAWVTSITTSQDNVTSSSIMLYGKSSEKVVSGDSIELDVQLDWYEENGNGDNGNGDNGGGDNGGGDNGGGDNGGGGNSGNNGSGVEEDYNIYLKYYAKDSLDSGKDYTLIKTIGGKTTYTFEEVEDNANLVNNISDLYSEDMWFAFTKAINGYLYAGEIENSNEDSVTVTTDDKGIIYVNYYLVKAKPTSECKDISGVSGQNNYTLKLYAMGDYEIRNSSDESILVGMWTTTEIDGYVSFSEFMYQKNGKKALSPHFYKDGELVMDGSDPRFDLKSDVVDFKASSGTFTLMYYDDDTSFPITFNIPQNFDIAEFEKSRDNNSSGGGGSGSGDSGDSFLHYSILINSKPNFTINEVYTQDPVYLNSGTLAYTINLTNETVTWSVKLYCAGKEIPANTYKVTSTSTDCYIKPIALPGGGTEVCKTMIVHITASTANSGSLTSNFQVVVPNKNIASLSLNDTEYLSKLIDLFETTSGPVDLKIDGTGLNIEYSEDANVYKTIAYIIKQYAKHPVQLDFSGIQTYNANYLDLNNFTDIVTSIKLPNSIAAIKFNPNLNIELIPPETNFFADATWYSVGGYNYTAVAKELEKIYAGSTCFINKLTSAGATCTEVEPYAEATTSWETLAMWIRGNYRDNFEILENQIVFVKGD